MEDLDTASITAQVPGGRRIHDGGGRRRRETEEGSKGAMGGEDRIPLANKRRG